LACCLCVLLLGATPEAFATDDGIVDMHYGNLKNFLSQAPGILPRNPEGAARRASKIFAYSGGVLGLSSWAHSRQYDAHTARVTSTNIDSVGHLDNGLRHSIEYDVHRCI
jgi:hypothetical protein